MILTFDGESIFRKFRLTTLNGLLQSAVVPVPEIDTTVACQSSYGGGSFQDVSGELIGVGQNRPVQRPP